MARLPLNHRRASGGSGVARNVSFAPPPSQLNRYNNDTSSDDDDDNDNPRHPYNNNNTHEENLNSDEEEQERILSQRYGEAGEAPSSSSTKQNSTSQEEEDQDFLNATSGTSTSTTRKRTRPTFTPSDLIGPKGLLKITKEFPTQVKKYRASSSSTTSSKQVKHKRDVEAAATYSSSLLHTYRLFCHDLCPNLAFADVLSRIEQYGSKKEVKEYTEQMRGDVRRRFVEGVYGVEKGGMMLQELEHGLRMQGQWRGGEGLEEEGGNEEVGMDVVGGADSEMVEGDVQVSEAVPEEEEEEMEANFQEDVFQEKELAAEMAMEKEEEAKSKSHKAAAGTSDKGGLVDTDDEEELEFVDGNKKVDLSDKVEHGEDEPFEEGLVHDADTPLPKSTNEKEETSSKTDNEEEEEEHSESKDEDNEKAKQDGKESKMSAASDEEKEANNKTADLEREDLIMDATQDTLVPEDESQTRPEQETAPTNDESEEQNLIVDATQDSLAPDGLGDTMESSQTLVVDATQESFGFTNETETVMPTLTAATECDETPEKTASPAYNSGEKLVVDNTQEDSLILTNETETVIPTLTAATTPGQKQEQNTIVEEDLLPSQIHFEKSEEEQLSATAPQEESENEGLVVDEEDTLTQQTVETATVVPSMTGNTQFGGTQQSMDY